MLHVQGAYKTAIDPASTTTGASQTLQVDTMGYDYLTVDAQLGHMSAGGAAPTTISLSESDDTNASNFATITGTSHTSNITTLPTTGVTLATWDVTLNARKRYVKVTITAGSTEVIGIMAQLTRGETLPVTATQKNVTSWIVI